MWDLRGPVFQSVYDVGLYILYLHTIMSDHVHGHHAIGEI